MADSGDNPFVQNVKKRPNAPNPREVADPGTPASGFDWEIFFPGNLSRTDFALRVLILLAAAASIAFSLQNIFGLHSNVPLAVVAVATMTYKIGILDTARMRNTGRSVFWLLFYLAPFADLALFLALFFIPPAKQNLRSA